MTDAIDVEVVDTTPVVGQQSAMVSTSDPYMGMAQMAMSQGKIAEMKELLAMKREWDAEEARKAFTAAMAAFKKKGLVVGKDKENKQYGSMYTTLGNLVNTASAVMAEFGLTVDWDIDQSSSTIKVTCVLEHEAGHSKRVTMVAEPDKSGAKNPIQQVKSAVTYLRGATFEAVTGIATSESAGINRDDDGNGAGGYDSSSWVEAIRDAVDKQELDRIAADLREVTGIPAPTLRNIRALWASRAKDLA